MSLPCDLICGESPLTMSGVFWAKPECSASLLRPFCRHKADGKTTINNEFDRFDLWRSNGITIEKKTLGFDLLTER